MTETNEPGYKVAADGHTYHKSATANATTAPTNEATIANASKTDGLSAEQAEFVTIVDYEWNRNRNIDPGYICKEYGFTADELKTLATNTLVTEALVQRGIRAHFFNPDGPVGKSKLSPIQLIVANSMLNLADTRPVKKKLQDCGVTPYQYQSWMKDPDFKDYMTEVSEGLLNDVSHEVMLSLIDKAASGDMKAIAYYHELTGRFIQTSANQGNNASAHDFQTMVIRIIEIVVDEVDDPNVAARISDRLKGLVMGAQVANALTEPIVQPEIAEARHLTSEQIKAVNRGVGVNE